MKLLKFALFAIFIAFIGQAQAVGWNELKAYKVTDATPIISSLKENTLVLQDPTGSISVEEALKRKDEFKSPVEVGPVDARRYYWIMQKITSGLDVDRSYRLDGRWLSMHSYVIDSDGSVLSLKSSGYFVGN